MLKLLRRVRQKLIDQGSLKRYLIYAIGEILLVMIGILLALQVSTWNQQKINNKKELKALVDLSKEFKLNKERIAAKQEARLSIEPKLQSYIEQVAAGTADYDSYKDFHSNPFLFGMTNPSHGVIDALISSGEIALITNDSLKYYLADWKNQAENLYENEEILWNSGLAYIGSATHLIPSPSQSWNDWDQKRLESVFDELITDIGHRNYLVGFEGTNAIVIQECNSILDLLEHILTLLEDEINKHQ